MVIPLNYDAMFVFELQGAVLTEDKYDLCHRVKIGIRHTVRENEASKHSSGIIHVINVDVASG